MFVISLTAVGQAGIRYWKQNGQITVEHVSAAKWFFTAAQANNAVDNIPRKYTVQIMQLVPYVEPAPASAVCFTQDHQFPL